MRIADTQPSYGGLGYVRRRLGDVLSLRPWPLLRGSHDDAARALGPRHRTVAQTVPAVCNLHGLACVAANTIEVSTDTVSRDNVDTGTAVQSPATACASRSGRTSKAAVALQIDNERAVAPFWTPSPMQATHGVGGAVSDVVWIRRSSVSPLLTGIPRRNARRTRASSPTLNVI